MTDNVIYATPIPAEKTGVSALVSNLALATAIRVFILAVGLVSLHLARPGTVPAFNVAHPWMGWDARHYYAIAANGYSPTRQGVLYDGWNSFNLIAYFPVVPLVGRALSSIMPLDVAMVLFSNLCALVGLGFLYDWARRITNERTATICLLATATFPGAVSLAAGMTEGPFLMLAAMALWLLQRRHWYCAALAVGIATATRPTGIALAMVIPFYVWTITQDFALPKRLLTFLLLSLISGGGLLLYESFLWHRYDYPTAYFDAQTNWSRLDQERSSADAAHGVKRYSWEFFKDKMTQPQSWNRGIALGILALCLVALAQPMGVPRVFFLLPLVIFLMTTLPGHGMRASSVPRYESAAIPIFLWVAIVLAPKRFTPLLISILLIQLAMQTYYAALFPREIWVG